MERIARRTLIGAGGLLALGPRMAVAAPAKKPRVMIQTGQGVIVVELEDKKLDSGRALALCAALPADRP